MTRLDSWFLALGSEKKLCPRCGNSFDCLHNEIANCHCVSIVLTENQREFIKQNYSDCLCNKCLLEIKEQRTKSQDRFVKYYKLYESLVEFSVLCPDRD